MSAHRLEFDNWSQADTRRHQKLRDQLGRQWHAVVSKKSGRPIGTISPMFRAPVTVGMRQVIPPGIPYLAIDKDEGTLVVDYERWARDLITAHDRYHQRAMAECLNREWNDHETRPYSPRLKAILGKEPVPYEPVLAAAQGNRWVLGFTEVIDERLAPMLKRQRRAAAAGIDFAGLPDFGSVPGEVEELEAEPEEPQERGARTRSRAKGAREAVP